MSEFDDLFAKDEAEEKRDNKKPAEKKQFDKGTWAEKKKQERADVYAMIDDATGKLAHDENAFRDYLTVQARFDRYSVSNAILIAHQMPTATKLADFDTWKNADAKIKKGEAAIVLMEPGPEYRREDGSTGFSVNIKKVFDITQTVDGKPVVQKHPEQRTAIKALINSSPCPIVMDGEKTHDLPAFYSPEEKKIYIRQGLSGEDIFRYLADEIATAKLASKDVNRQNAGFYSYCVSFILCERNGIDTGGIELSRISEVFVDIDGKSVRGILSTIRDMTNDISKDMSRQFEAIEKENRKREDAVR